MEFLKKVDSSVKEGEGVQLGDKFYAQKEDFDSNDVVEMNEYAESSQLPIFTNVNLEYPSERFIGTGIGENVIKDNDFDVYATMFAMSKLIAKSGEKLFALNGGTFPTIRLVRPFQLKDASFDNAKFKKEVVEELIDEDPAKSTKLVNGAPNMGDNYDENADLGKKEDASSGSEFVEDKKEDAPADKKEDAPADKKEEAPADKKEEAPEVIEDKKEEAKTTGKKEEAKTTATKTAPAPASKK